MIYNGLLLILFPYSRKSKVLRNILISFISLLIQMALCRNFIWHNLNPTLPLLLYMVKVCLHSYILIIFWCFFSPSYNSVFPFWIVSSHLRQEESSHQNPSILSPWSWTYQAPELRENKFLFFEPVMASYYGSPRWQLETLCCDSW